MSTIPVITAITASPRREGRFDVLVDGKPVAALSLDTVERLRLHVGTPWGEPLVARVAEAAAVLRTFDRALDMLAARPRATRELERLLLRKGESAPNVAAALERLTTLGLLDDAQYARQFVRAKMGGPGLSKRRLQTELWRRGVAREVADAAIAEVVEQDAIDTEEMIDRVADKKLRTLARLDPDTRRRRLYAHLARRGYDPDEIRRVLDRVRETVEDTDGE
jgi:regulatory protein